MRGRNQISGCDDGLVSGLEVNTVIDGINDSDLRASALRVRPESGDPRWLHAKVVDALRLGARWRAWQTLEIELDWQQLLAMRGRTHIDVRLTDAHPCPQRAKRLVIVG